MPRVVIWFSCGAASAVAARLTLKKYRDTHEVVITRIVIADEHPDGDRFAADCQKWFDHPITTITSSEYADCADVFEKRRFMSGPHGATCTGELKKAPRYEFQKPDDIQIFGFTAEEWKRANRFREQNFDITMEAPLIDNGLSKSDCHALIERAGIKQHAMYYLGFPNANCRGCVKANGPGYWNLTRQHFPEVFQSRAEQSRRIGCRLVRVGGERIFLDELPPGIGDIKSETTHDCSILCAIAETKM